MRKKATIFSVIILGLAAYFETARGQMPAEKALRSMKVAEGLEITLFASEPDLVNPTSMDIDAQGRVWVTEAVNYRLFRNPLMRREGDRIRILEDTDGDGRCDRATTFYQDPSLQAPLGIAVLGRRVYVCQSPDLFYLEDTDGDGVADKKTVVLRGFKGLDHDHAIHGIMFGPDGWLYFSNGDQGLDVTDKQGNRVWVGPNAPHMAASVLRTDLEGDRLEFWAEGLRNPYEPAVDSFGNVFISDNDDDGNEQCRIVFVMEGGNYGYWPRRRGNRRLDEVHWNEDIPGVVPKILRTGFGSPTGMIFYEGKLLPERFRRTLLLADAGPGVIRSFPLRPRGAAFSTEIQTLLSCPGDKWFRPIDVSAAPDGSLFVADWYDPGVGGHHLADFTRGRIYRLAPPGKPSRVQKANLTSLEDSATALASPNQATRFLAYERFKRDGSEEARKVLESLAAKDDDVLRARALWLLASKGEAGRKEVLEAARGPRPEFRTLAVRILAGQGSERLREVDWLLEDPDAGVRRELLLHLQHIREPWGVEWILKLADRFDGQDRFYREALGIALRGREGPFFSEIARRSSDRWDKRLAEIALQLHTPEAVEMARAALMDQARPIDHRLNALKVIAAAGGDKAKETLMDQLDARAPQRVLLGVIDLLTRDEGRAWPAIRRDERMSDFIRAALPNSELRTSGEKLIRELRLTEFVPQLTEMAKNRRAASAVRLEAMETIRHLQSPASLDPLRGLMGDPDKAIALAAARAIGALGNDEAQQTLKAILLDSAQPQVLRKEIVRLLGAMRSGALLLLQTAEQGKLSQDLVLDATAVTHASPYENIRLMADQILPEPRTRTGKTLPPIPALLRISGDAARGRSIFFGSEGPQCSRCHKIAGEGQDVGPDLSHIGGKLAREALLESILNPSAAVAHEYQVWLVRTKSKGYLDGYIRAETNEAIDLIDSNGNTIQIPVADILARTKSTASLMPSGLSSGMTTQQLVDLAELLSTLK